MPVGKSARIVCFSFVHFDRMPVSCFVKFVAGLATQCTVKEKTGHEKVGSIGQENDGDAHSLQHASLISSLPHFVLSIVLSLFLSCFFCLVHITRKGTLSLFFIKKVHVDTV